MGQVLGFAHCKEAPSTASSTPDSTPSATDAAIDESDFPELQTAREFSEDEEETSQDWGTPRELTFSYITFSGSDGASPGSSLESGIRPKRDSSSRELDGSSRLRKSKPQQMLALARSDTCETFLSGLADSLENIPSLSQSPETEHQLQTGRALASLGPLLGWDTDISYMDSTELPEDRMSGHESHKHEGGKVSHFAGLQVRPGTEEKGGVTAVEENDLASPDSCSRITSTGAKQKLIPCTFMQHLGATVPSPVSHALEGWQPLPTSAIDQEEDKRASGLTMTLHREEADNSGIKLGIFINDSKLPRHAF
ncbi:reticulon-2 [Microcaecilia unicolor]|uniref:Reticulon-2-like n=1 Tax=Microcaecilia unicolor TaxID=1415580 RepID=A0A6P7ZPL7_9AMPH|nr:reticulon-2-like [Microcaecilia unicolor]